MQYTIKTTSDMSAAEIVASGELDNAYFPYPLRGRGAAVERLTADDARLAGLYHDAFNSSAELISLFGDYDEEEASNWVQTDLDIARVGMMQEARRQLVASLFGVLARPAASLFYAGAEDEGFYDEEPYGYYLECDDFEKEYADD